VTRQMKARSKIGAICGLLLLAGCATSQPQVDSCAPIANEIAQQMCYQTVEMRREARQRAIANALDFRSEQANWNATQNAINNAPIQPIPFAY